MQIRKKRAVFCKQNMYTIIHFAKKERHYRERLNLAKYKLCHFTNEESRLNTSFTCANEERIEIVETSKKKRNHVQTNKCTLQTRKERKVTVQSASKNQNIVAVPGNANWVNKEIVLTSKKNIVQRRIERLLCKVQAGVGNIVTLPKEGGVGRG